MNNIKDEILNKYLDGELNVEESEHVKSELQSSEELRIKFNTLNMFIINYLI